MEWGGGAESIPITMMLLEGVACGVSVGMRVGVDLSPWQK